MDEQINEYIFDCDKPEEYPFGYHVELVGARPGLLFAEKVPNLPPEGEWIITESLPYVNYNKVRVIRIRK